MTFRQDHLYVYVYEEPTATAANSNNNNSYTREATAFGWTTARQHNNCYLVWHLSLSAQAWLSISCSIVSALRLSVSRCSFKNYISLCTLQQYVNKFIYKIFYCQYAIFCSFDCWQYCCLHSIDVADCLLLLLLSISQKIAFKINFCGVYLRWLLLIASAMIKRLQQLMISSEFT